LSVPSGQGTGTEHRDGAGRPFFLFSLPTYTIGCGPASSSAPKGADIMAKILRNRILLIVIALLAAGGIALSFFWESIALKPQLARIFPTMSVHSPMPTGDAREAGESGNGQAQEVPPGTTAKKKQQDFQIILKRHLFGKSQDSKKTGTEQAASVPLTATSLDLSLLGTITGPPDKRRAVILDKKKKAQELYGQGDTVQGSLIKEILRDKIILTVNGKDEVLLPEIPRKNPAPGVVKTLPAQQRNAIEAPVEEDNPDTLSAVPNEPEVGDPPMEPENPMEQAESTPEVTGEPMGKNAGNLPPVRRNQDKSSFKKNTQGKP
jgi:hypothetical protein